MLPRLRFFTKSPGLQPLLHALKDPDPVVRESSIETLGQLSQKGAIGKEDSAYALEDCMDHLYRCKSWGNDRRLLKDVFTRSFQKIGVLAAPALINPLVEFRETAP
jgi:HEAT repeat protein